MTKELVASAGLSAGSALLQQVTLSLWGVPVAVVMAAGAGALFGATYFPPDAKISKVWATLCNAAASLTLTSLASHWTGLTAAPLMSGVAFIVAVFAPKVVLWAAARIGISVEAPRG